MKEYIISYDIWKQIAQNNAFNLYHSLDGYQTLGLFTGNRDYIYHTHVVADDYEDWVTNFQGSSSEVDNHDDPVVLLSTGTSNIKETAHTSDNLLRVSAEKPAEGDKVTLISLDWGDKTTWYYKARKILDGYQLDDYGDHQTYEGYGVWIDNFHGKYTDEDFLTNDLGEVPRLKVYVDGYEKVENDPHTGVGDYTVDYHNARVTFNSALDENAIVTVDAWLAQGSTWSIVPEPGKKIVIDYVEVQFEEDVRVKDTVVFQTWVYYPPIYPNKVPYGDPTKYKTLKDYINESNRSYPVIQKSTNQNPTWRDLQKNMNIYVWDYQTSLELKSSVGAEIRIFLEHEEAFEGSATVAFYCRVFDE